MLKLTRPYQQSNLIWSTLQLALSVVKKNIVTSRSIAESFLTRTLNLMYALRVNAHLTRKPYSASKRRSAKHFISSTILFEGEICAPQAMSLAGDRVHLWLSEIDGGC